MINSRRSKAISQIVTAFLTDGESDRVDFKRTPDGVAVDDFVAFANTSAGGTILVGIDEKQGPDGTQVGVIVGCDVSDEAILKITNKALSCIPPVAIEVRTENLAKRPFLRVDVPPSATRPHCTPRGLYCKRDGSRNRPLQPPELLRIFLETEASTFAERFESAAGRIATDLKNLEISLDASIERMADQLGWTDMQLGETESTLNTIQSLVLRVSNETNDISARLRALFRQDKREDPIRERERKKLLLELVEQVLKDDELLRHVVAGGRLTANASGKAALELTEKEAGEVLKDALERIRAQADLNKYSVVITAPNKCSGSELDQFAALVIVGGEVTEGIQARLKSAYRLGFVVYEGEVVGTAAIKKPLVSYRRKVFANAQSNLDPSDFPYELGWIYLHEQHRRKGQISRLLEEMMPLTKNKAVFSTTRSDNAIMQELLKQLEFRKEGVSYKSAQQLGKTIDLFVRPDGSKDGPDKR
ncbi:GNAT family N-acetyltransferase [Hoeflea sp. AS60]|uniref:GNAT family N-acetyltransferase n=1 Tax=Hoeflea sp. AS60 TaxID=3135780 RepID=UPI003181A5B2